MLLLVWAMPVLVVRKACWFEVCTGEANRDLVQIDLPRPRTRPTVLYQRIILAFFFSAIMAMLQDQKLALLKNGGAVVPIDIANGVSFFLLFSLRPNASRDSP
jgi:hypothetical protein